MNQRMMDIAHELSGDAVFTIDELAHRHGVSARTIRNDLNQIDDALRRAGEPGIRLERGSRVLCMGDATVLTGLGQSPLARASYHLAKQERLVIESVVVVATPGPTTLGTLAEGMGVSRATVINDLDEMKALVAAAGLEVVSRAGKGLIVAGPESARRRFLLRIACQASGAAAAIVERQVPVLAGDPEVLEKLLREQELAAGCVLTDESRKNMVLYLRIVVARLLMDQSVEPEVQGPESGSFAAMAEGLMANVCRYCHLAASPAERLAHQQYARREVENDDAPKIQVITRSYIDRVSDELGIDLTDDFGFFEKLAEHFESVLQPQPVEYPDTPFIREVIAQNEAIVRAGRELTELEVGYIALHIAAAIERKKSAKAALHVVVACNAGVGTSQLLLENLRKSFNFKIIGAVTSDEAERIEPTEADLIVSSVPLTGAQVDWVQVSPLFTEEDLLRVAAKVNVLRAERNLTTVQAEVAEPNAKDLLAQLAPAVYEQAPAQAPALMRSISRIVTSYFASGSTAGEALSPALGDLLRPGHIRLDVPCATWREAVRASARVLVDGGYIEPRYVDAMILNIEENGPYVVMAPGFALPHEGIDQGVREMGFSLVRLAVPVVFDDETAQAGARGILGADGAAGEPSLGSEDVAAQPVRFVCCMAAVDHKSHLRAFFNLLKLMKLPEFQAELAAAATPEEAAGIIERWEDGL